jgi:hypothetical protein
MFGSRVASPAVAVMGSGTPGAGVPAIDAFSPTDDPTLTGTWPGQDEPTLLTYLLG